MYRLLFTKQAQKDAGKLSASNLKGKAEEILDVLRSDPFCDYQPYEKLIGDLTGSFSRRVNIQHRIVYQVMEEEKIVKILRMWTHYE
jgi:Txe/YoeB family toxin of toxin-antitoxin system